MRIFIISATIGGTIGYILAHTSMDVRLIFGIVFCIGMIIGKVNSIWK